MKKPNYKQKFYLLDKVKGSCIGCMYELIKEGTLVGFRGRASETAQIVDSEGYVYLVRSDSLEHL